ncbi:MAG TPA: aminotransferase class V-fold PLP-dependent enzyme [Verrucomicrobiae bacterium]|nr:aminotransferase class V-fold PLP-dependent enzyme [Verrucomicrobiae bacterium]
MKPELDASLQQPAGDPAVWPLDPAVCFLNHGSFGSCPRPVLQFQQELRARLERQPVRFFVRDWEGLWDEARHELAQFLQADPDGLVFVPNATAGVNAVLRSLRFTPEDELLVTDHEYNACANVLKFVAEMSGARVITVAIPFPLRDPEEIIPAILERVTRRTRLALLDHVTSQTGLILPLPRLVAALAERGVDTLVDGAHAPGMLPLDLNSLGAAYYTGNCHKWLCAPKGAAFLVARADRRAGLRPPVISHGANSPRTDRSKFLIEFGWMGTGDPTPSLCVPEAIRFLRALLPGGWPAIQERNRRLALAARAVLCQALEQTPPAPEECIGSLVSLPMPDAESSEPSRSPLYLDPLQDELLNRYSIEVPIIPWPQPPQRLLRISAQLYNSLPQYRHLASALRELLHRQ